MALYTVRYNEATKYWERSVDNTVWTTFIENSPLEKVFDKWIDFNQLAAPGLSPANAGRIYFDSTSKTFKISENGGAYQNLSFASPLTTKGDIFAYSTLGTRLPIGRLADALFPDPAQTFGMAWKSMVERAILFDDFIVGFASWSNFNSGGSLASIAPESNHPGVISFTSNAVNGNYASLRANEAVFLSDIESIIFVVKVIENTGTKISLGLAQDNSNTDLGTDSVYIQFNASANVNWRGVSRLASASTFFATTVAVAANTWYLVELRRNGSNWEVYINDVLSATINSGIPAGSTPLYICMRQESTNAALHHMYIDAVQANSIDLGRRF